MLNDALPKQIRSFSQLQKGAFQRLQRFRGQQGSATIVFPSLYFNFFQNYHNFNLGMYALTYIGRMFNGLTLIIIAWVAIFSAPRIYKDNQVSRITNIACIMYEYTKLDLIAGQNRRSSTTYQGKGGRLIP